jgi:hypothetical protein
MRENDINLRQIVLLKEIKKGKIDKEESAFV